jgi:xanthine dehydrogenase accessory factor
VSLEQARRAVAAGQPCLLVVVTRIAGSAPREPGALMLVTAEGIDGSIGGGRLEYEAIAAARRGLAEGAAPGLRRFALGPDLGQCCGGQAELAFAPLAAGDLGWLERWQDAAAGNAPAGVLVRPLAPTGAPTWLEAGGPAAGLPEPVRHRALALLGGEADAASLELGGVTWLLARAPRPLDRLFLYGAGHVGRAVARAVAPLPFRLDWLDERPELVAGLADPRLRLAPDPAVLAAAAPAGAFHLVMTHSHGRDYEICEAVLRRGDFAFLGLIGSETKRARFASRLRAAGLSAERVARLTSPIGLPEIAGKQPAVIAVSVAAQLVALAEQLRQARPRGAATAP